MHGLALIVSVFYISYRCLTTFVFMPLAGGKFTGTNLLELFALLTATVSAFFIYKLRRAPALAGAAITLSAGVTYTALAISAQHGLEVSGMAQAFVLPELVFFAAVVCWYWFTSAPSNPQSKS